MPSPAADSLASNLRDAFSVYSKTCGERVERFPGVTCVRHQSKTSAFNMAFLNGGAGVGQRTLRSAQDFYREIGAEWCFIVPPELAGLFDSAMGRIQISQRKVLPTMVLSRGRVSMPPPLTGLDVRRVKSLDELRTWVSTASMGFEDSQNTFRYMINRSSLAPGGFTCHTGFASGKAVSTSASYTSVGVTGVFAVSTVPFARGRGYGEAMTWAAVRDGLSRGSDTLYLQASPMGFPLYHRMGFRRVFDFEAWVVPKDAPNARD